MPSRKRIRRALLALAAVLASAAVAAAPRAPLAVATGILPLKFFIERVGGQHVTVTAMVGSGASPETYEPTPLQMAAVARAEIYVAIHVPFERAWLARIGQQNPHLRIVDCRPPETRADTQAGDAHIWTSPRVAAGIARCVADALGAIDPARAGDYRAGADALVRELDLLDTEIRRRLAAAAVRSFLVYHPAWDFYAREYGLVQVAIEADGKAPSARHLAQVIERARRERLRTIFVQPQLAGAAAAAAARELGARIVVLDPLAESYIESLRSVTDAVAGSPSAP
ncbi:MAG: metal ABC transporter solute-binding protein, Zn/Mn family [Gammaproteobacteria bacterium]